MTLNLNRPALKQTIKTTAASRLAMIAAQKASPGLIKAAQKVLAAKSLFDALFGKPLGEHIMPSLGYLTLHQVQAIQTKINEMGPGRANLFFVRITDGNPPWYDNGGPELITKMFDMLCTSVSYAPSTITGEKTPIGSANMDRVTGTESVDLQLTTMDDEIGTLKAWFDAKAAQVCAPDGTFGLPSEYTLTIEVVHGVASNEAKAEIIDKTYRALFLMRPSNIQHELSRQEVGVQQLQMTFTQIDSWRTQGAARRP